MECIRENRLIWNIIQLPKKGDFVTSRLLWLKGLELGKNLGGNVDSYERRIYIHGTPEEGLIGTPSSHGCIRMTNHQVIELFNLAEKGLNVLISWMYNSLFNFYL